MIFLYHGIVADDASPDRKCAGHSLPLGAFMNQIHWLKKHFEILPLTEYMNSDASRRERARRVAAITFDDGLARTFELVFPFLRTESVPFTIFVTTSHLERPTLLWFSYLNALCFEDVYEWIVVTGKSYALKELTERRRTREALGAEARASGSPAGFARELEDRYPLPPLVRKAYEGMAQDQLDDAMRSGIVEVGSHSMTHPFLSQIPSADQAREIRESKAILSERLNRPVRFFAYPAGDYTADTITAVRQAGYAAAFATIPKGLSSDKRFEMSRIGIYSSSLLKVQLKAIGVAEMARSIGFNVG